MWWSLVNADSQATGTSKCARCAAQQGRFSTSLTSFIGGDAQVSSPRRSQVTISPQEQLQQGLNIPYTLLAKVTPCHFHHVSSDAQDKVDVTFVGDLIRLWRVVAGHKLTPGHSSGWYIYNNGASSGAPMSKAGFHDSWPIRTSHHLLQGLSIPIIMII